MALSAPALNSQPPALDVRGLRVETPSGAPIVADVSLQLAPGEALGLVGESGSGKTTTVLSLLGYTQAGARITAGEIAIRGEAMEAATAGPRSPAARPPDLLRPAEPRHRPEPLDASRSGGTRHAAGALSGQTAPALERRRIRTRTGRAACRPVLSAALPAPAFGRPAAARLHRGGARL